MKITLKYKLHHYSEVDQSIKNRFGFLNPENNTVEHRPVLCRDFLLDTLVSDEIKFQDSIYGYRYWKDVDKNWGLVLFDSAKHPAFYAEQIEEFHEIEIANGFTPTEFIPVSEVKNLCTHQVSLIPRVVCYGDPGWYKNTALFSTWTFLLRYVLGSEFSTYKNLVKDADTVINRASVKTPQLLEIMRNLPETEQKSILLKKKYDDEVTIHNNNGFATLILNPKSTIFGEYANEIKSIWNK